MRLLTKTTLYFLLAMLSLLAITGFLLFVQFNKQINARADSELTYEELQWVNYLEKATLNGSNFLLQTQEILIYPTDKPVKQLPRLSTIYSNKVNDKTTIPFRQLDDVVNINGTAYEIIIRKSQEQKLILITNIVSILLIVLAALLLAMLLINWFLNKRLWKPFQTSLHKIRNMGLPQTATIHFGKANTQEFNELNMALNTMVNKIHHDYVNMKEFTEDAAHEMQTPLAVAQSKLELLLQDTSLTCPQTETIAQTAIALSRLSKLNHSLLLLAKIENQQYEAEGIMDLVAVTKKYLHLFEELIKEKELIVETNFQSSFNIKIHPFLADSLIGNLIGNAVKYNYHKGKISMDVDANRFCIGNTSPQKALDAQNLFKRFNSTPDRKNNSTGLGLAIVKKIADTNGLSVAYHHSEEMHSFCLIKTNATDQPASA